MEQETHNKELQLLPTLQSLAASSPSSSLKYISASQQLEAPAVDLQLSMSLRPQPDCILPGPVCENGAGSADVEALKWQAAEQIRLAAMERAYAERVRELTRQEMELAQSEFARARHVWERARAEVERAERMKERATRRVDSTCMEITCQSCSQKFRS